MGIRIESCRIAREWTQARLAREAGLSKRTIERLEAGHSIQLTSFLKILTALGLVGDVLAAIPSDELSPVDELEKERSSKRRQRASTSRLREREARKTWKWGDEK